MTHHNNPINKSPNTHNPKNPPSPILTITTSPRCANLYHLDHTFLLVQITQKVALISIRTLSSCPLPALYFSRVVINHCQIDGIASDRMFWGKVNHKALAKGHLRKRWSNISSSWSHITHLGLTIICLLNSSILVGNPLCNNFYKNIQILYGIFSFQRFFQPIPFIP